MDRQERHHRGLRGRMVNRRRFVQGTSIAVAGSGAWLIACGGDGDKGTSGSSGDVTTVGGRDGAAAAPTSAATVQAETPMKGGILTSQSIDPPTGDFDYLTTAAPAVITPIAHVYNGLLRLDYDNSLKPDLALSQEQVSPTELVFKLRPGVQWHDGKPFTAEDVVTTLEWIRKPPEGKVSPRRSLFVNVASITAVDASTVSIKLMQPSASLPLALASPWNKIAPKHVLSVKGDLKSENVGTGAFKFETYNKGIETKLVRNPNYFEQGLPHLDGVTFKVMADTTQRNAAFATKQIVESGFANGTEGKAWIDTLRKDMQGKVNIVRLYATLVTYICLHAEKKPFDDPRVRRAVALAVNHPEAISAVGFGEARLSGPIPTDPWALPDAEVGKLPGYGADKGKDLADAKAMLSAAGVTDLKFDIEYQALSDYGDNAAYFAQSLNKLGITVTPKGYQTAEVLERRANGRFTAMYYIEGLGLNDPDDSLLRPYLTGASANYGRFTDAAIDARLQAQSRELDAAKRRALTDQIQKDLVTQHAPRLYLPLRPFWRALWVDVRNFKAGPDLYGHYQLRDIWLKSS